MGFYINICRCLNVCPETGKPYYYDFTGGQIKKVYGIREIVIPEQYRRFLHEKGSIFRAYMIENEHYTDIRELNERFPSWDDVKEEFPEAEEEYGWTKKDHDLFEKAVEWFSTNGNFVISWG
jgi:hypothetical protein